MLILIWEVILMYKKIFMLTLVLLCITVSVNAAPKPIEIYIDQQKIESDVAPVIINNRTLVPIRVISENLGAKVEWDGTERKVLIQTTSKTIVLKIDYKKALINGKEVNLDVPPTILKNRTMVPLRFISEALGADVSWDGENRRVDIKQQRAQIINFTQGELNGDKAVIIYGEGKLDYNIVEDTGKKLVFDINAELATPDNRISIDNIIEKAIIEKIKGESPLSRVTIDFSNKVDYEIKQSTDKQTIYVISKYSPANNKLNNVKLEKDGDELTAYIKTDVPADYNYFSLSNPDRLVIEINNTVLSEIDIDIPENEYVENVRLGQFSVNPYTARVVFDLKSKSKNKVICEGNTIKLVFNKPSRSGKLIVVDPGHGGSDPGACSDNVKEKDLTLDISFRLRDLLENGGFDVIMTREEDIYVDTYRRPAMANEVDADLFISVHINSFTNSNPSGLETLCYPSEEKKKLAIAIQNSMVETLGLLDRGIVAKSGYIVTRETKMPSALAEVGFISNPNDRSLLVTEEFRQKAAEAIYRGIINYLSNN